MPILAEFYVFKKLPQTTLNIWMFGKHLYENAILPVCSPNSYLQIFGTEPTTITCSIGNLSCELDLRVAK